MSDGWAPNPADVIVRSDSGTGDMGDVDNKQSVARFSADTLTLESFVLIFIRAHFSGSTGTADLLIKLDSHLGPSHDVLLGTLSARGVGSDLFFRVDREEYEKWVFDSRDFIVLEWANPDTDGEMSWGVEVGIGFPDVNRTI